MQLFEQKKSDGQWTCARFLRQIFSKNELFWKILAFLESAQRASLKNGLTFLIWWTLSFDLFLARARQLKTVNYHSLTHLRLFSMLSDAKLGHFEVITPQQYNGYPWWTTYYEVSNTKRQGNLHVSAVLETFEKARSYILILQVPGLSTWHQNSEKGLRYFCTYTLTLTVISRDSELVNSVLSSI